jgi:ribonuclease HI
MITGGVQRRLRHEATEAGHVAITGPVVQTKWSHVPLTFDARDVDLRSAPHMDAMVINCSVAGWDLHKVLVDNGSQAGIIFLHAFDRLGISHSLLKPSDNPLYGFGGKGTFPMGKIELPLSFGAAPNTRSEQITFDIVDMVYPYNAIMGRGSINKFEAAIHGLYLCMKIPGPQGVITVYGNQQTVRNIERDFVLGQRNVHCLTMQREGTEATRPATNEHEKAQLQSNDGTKTVPLDQATPKQTVIISEDLTSQDEEKLISCLSRNKDIFAWSALDLVGVSRTIIEHNLGIDPSMRPKKQRLCKMSNEKTEAAKAEVHRLLEANFIEPIVYPTWLANVVMVQKKSGKWRMCIDFTSLNKACPKDNFPLPRIDKIVDSAAGCEVMSLLDCFSGYHQIYMKEEDKASTSFITPFGTYCFVRMPEGLKNVGSTFSRLTKTVLEGQVGRNIFTYVDDIVVASKNKEDHLADLAETFASMRDARLRLNPEKCVFGVRQGKILGYLVSHHGIEANPTKIQAIINMTPPQSARDVQRLTGRLAALNRFISKSAERSLPFLKTLCGAKDFAWGPEQAAAFASLKQHLSELATLTSPDPSLPLLLYVAASPQAVSAALVQEQDREGTTRQCPVYYVSEVLTTSKCNMTELEKIAYTVVMASRKLRHYFEAFKVRVTSDRGLGKLFRNMEASVRIAKSAAELSEYHITFEPRTAIKSQVLVDFIVDWTRPARQQEEPSEKVWTIHCNGAWCHTGAGAAAIVTSPTGVKHRYAARLSFALESDRCTNNIAESEAVILGLRKLKALGVATCIVKTDSKVVTGQVEKEYLAKDPALMQYLTTVRNLEKQFKGFTLQHVDHAKNEEADALAKAAAKGEALPSDVFYHFIGTLAVRNPKGLQITNDAEGHRMVNLIMTEDWRAPIILFLQGYYHPSDINEAKRLKYHSRDFALIEGQLYKKGVS